MMNRKQFLVNSAFALSGTLISGDLLAGAFKKSSLVGLQLYSVRTDMKNDPLGTLKALSEMGYKNVEHANYSNRKFYGHDPKEFKKILRDLGMKMPSGHTVLNGSHWDKSKGDFTDVWKATVEDAALAGQKYVISPWLNEELRKDYDGLLTFLDIFNKSGELCRKSGLKFGYHNHNFEFSNSLNGKLVYEIILEHTDPELVIQQIDIGNMYGAGGRALDLLKKYPGRFTSMHVKDEIKSSGNGEMNDGYDSTVIGKGILPVKEILDAFKKTGGTTEFIIEQESYQNQSPLEAAKADLEAMNSWGY
jgi:sugar phosphate isomerase/epimerase